MDGINRRTLSGLLLRSRFVQPERQRQAWASLSSLVLQAPHGNSEADEVEKMKVKEERAEAERARVLICAERDSCLRLLQGARRERQGDATRRPERGAGHVRVAGETGRAGNLYRTVGVAVLNRFHEPRQGQSQMSNWSDAHHYGYESTRMSLRKRSAGATRCS